MLLYHFTSRERVSGIRTGGLRLGTVPVSATKALQAVWLTSRGDDGAHGLEAGGPLMSEEQRHETFQWTGDRPPPGARLPKEASVRITVDIHSNDRDLHEWLPWARQHVAPDTMALLHPVGSSLHKAKSWRLYFGWIPPERFVTIEEVVTLTQAPQI